MAAEPRPNGKIVQVANFGSRLEADAAMALLEANGIQASGKYGDAGGWLPHIALLDGFRVLVFDEDLETAKALIDTEDFLETARILESDEESDEEPGPDPG
jgi:Putative prokaryotic signal transducing protein